MEKIMTAALVLCLCAFALSFAPAPVSAGPFDEVIGAFSDDDDDKPTPNKNTNGGLKEQIEAIKAELEALKPKVAPPPEVATAKDLILVFILIGMIGLLGAVAIAIAVGVRRELSTAMKDVAKLREEVDGLAIAWKELQEELDDDDPVAPPA